MPNSIENRRFRKNLLRIVSIPIVFILVLLTFFHFQTSYRNRIIVDIAHLDEARLTASKIGSLYANLENNIRGYVISGRGSFLDSMKIERAKVEKLTENLFDIIGEDKNLSRQLRQLNKSYDRFLDYTAEVQRIRDQRDADAKEDAEEIVLEKDHIFSLLLEGHNNFLNEILKKRDATLKKLEDVQALTWALEIIFTLILLFFVVFIISGQLKNMIKDYQRLLLENKKNLQELQKSLQTKDLFLANMSHELRTPLGAITGFSELASNFDNLPTEVKNHLSYIKRNSEHLLALIDDLFDVSRLEADKLDMVKGEVDIRQMLMDIKNDLLSRATDQRVTIAMTVEDHVPKFVETDPVRLKQILTNLMGNAVKFSNYNTTVTVTASYDKRCLTFNVIDQGIGIDPKKQATIFKAFSQAEPEHSRKYGGAGLGLSISKKLAEILEGDLELVSSQIDKGSHFRLFLPANPAGTSFVTKDQVETTISEKAGHKEEEVVAKKTFDFTGRRILLAEDSKENQILFKIFIESSRADLDIVDNGTDVVRKALAESFDLILMDIQMPGLDGYEAVKILRGSHYERKVFALTAHTMKGEREKCLNAGFDGYLTKPISQQQLLSAVEQGLQK